MFKLLLILKIIYDWFFSLTLKDFYQHFCFLKKDYLSLKNTLGLRPNQVYKTEGSKLLHK